MLKLMSLLPPKNFHQTILFQLEYIILRIFLNTYVQIDIFITPKKFSSDHFISIRAHIFKLTHVFFLLESIFFNQRSLYSQIFSMHNRYFLISICI